MRKSTVIATCLVNSNMFRHMDNAENRVLNVFLDEFPRADFSLWNAELNDAVATSIIQSVGRASRINVKRFIEDLWK